MYIFLYDKLFVYKFIIAVARVKTDVLPKGVHNAQQDLRVRDVVITMMANLNMLLEWK